jgi:hypothetical protein
MSALGSQQLLFHALTREMYLPEVIELRDGEQIGELQ